MILVYILIGFIIIIMGVFCYRFYFLRHDDEVFDEEKAELEYFNEHVLGHQPAQPESDDEQQVHDLDNHG